MSVRAAQLLLVVCWLIGLPFAAPALAEKRIGLVIANQNYTALELKLENTHRDGELIEKALEQVGFDVTLVNYSSLPQQVLAGLWAQGSPVPIPGPLRATRQSRSPRWREPPGGLRHPPRSLPTQALRR